MEQASNKGEKSKPQRGHDSHGVDHTKGNSVGYSGIQPPEPPKRPEESRTAEAPVLVDVLQGCECGELGDIGARMGAPRRN